MRRGEHNRLGFAVQLGTVRFLGTFLPDPADVPWSVAAHLAGQLGVADPGVLKQYAARDGTNRLHAGQIQQAYGYRDFTDPQVQHDLVHWLQARSRLATERPGVLFDLATARLLEAKVLLPGPTVLARLVASVRDQAATRLWQTLADVPDAAQRARLEGLLAVAAGERTSTLERLRRGPTSVTAAGLLGALHRLDEIRALGVGELDLSFVPPGRLEALARHAATARTQALARMGEQRRTATLLAAARQLETDAGDDALDLLDQLLGALLARADRAGTRERLRTLPTLDLAASQLRDAVKVLLDPPAGDLPALWAAIGRTVSREQLTAAVEAVDATTRPAADTHLDDLLARYSLVRRFLPTLLASLRLQAAPAGVDVLAAWEALGALEGRRSVRADEVPLTLATGPWVTRVHGPDGLLHRPAFTLLVLERLREALRRRDVYATTSRRWSDPRAQLLSGSAWEAARAGVATSLFRLLGYQFSPRLADIGSARFWRITRNADYGPLGGLARHHINTDLIAAHWDDLLRVAGSLATGTVRASELLRVLQGGGRPTPLGRAVAELGRITKTLYLLAYLDDETYRRRILTQLNRTESRHALARAVFHGQRGQLRQRYREGQEDQLGALGLVVNAIVLWNTRYQNAALDQLRRDGHDVRDDDLRRLSPLGHDHLNLLGRYQFSAPDLPDGQLRALRDPAT